MNNQEFAIRRRRFIRKMCYNSIAILPAAPVQLRTRSLEHPYQQDRNLLYLTGFPEPQAVAVIIRQEKQGKFILFCRDHNSAEEQWTGPRAGLDGAVQAYGADTAYDIKELDKRLPEMIANRDAIYYALGCYADFDSKLSLWIRLIREMVRTGASEPQQCISVDHMVHEMRLIKSRAEIRAMRYAARISAKAHRRAMLFCRGNIHEYEVEAELRHEFMRHGCHYPAYDPIVAGGANACILHYTRNDAVLNDSDLLLIDAAAEYEHYAADITRTFPVSGRFNAAQKTIYELVLAAQTAAIKRVRPGRRFSEPHDAAVKVIASGLASLGLLKGNLSELLEKHAYRRFFMHRTSHWLGLDVHDVGNHRQNKRWRRFEPGMVITVEPGIYIRAHSKGVAKKWWDIGVRIEDDVLVTRKGNEVLSKDAPKTVAEIERIMRKGAKV